MTSADFHQLLINFFVLFNFIFYSLFCKFTCPPECMQFGLQQFGTSLLKKKLDYGFPIGFRSVSSTIPQKSGVCPRNSSFQLTRQCRGGLLGSRLPVARLAIPSHGEPAKQGQGCQRENQATIRYLAACQVFFHLPGVSSWLSQKMPRSNFGKRGWCPLHYCKKNTIAQYHKESVNLIYS